jgi:ABC-type dipeptide/oligopeptide/nickel transport system ATPase component
VRVRGQEIGLVLQSPTASLNPAMRIERQLGEAWRAHVKGTRDELADAVKKALLQVGLPCDKEFRRRYPSQISVGQAQRVLIAMAVMHSPALLIADEPTSALDAMTQVDTLNMLSALNRSMGTAILYISHDLQSVASICQRIAILRNGEIVECGDSQALLLHPRHPYTQRLLACAPWLPWWMEESQRSQRQALRQARTESVAAQHPAPEQLYGRLKSPGQPPMSS